LHSILNSIFAEGNGVSNSLDEELWDTSTSKWESYRLLSIGCVCITPLQPVFSTKSRRKPLAVNPFIGL
jgi:hypothetical protein